MRINVKRMKSIKESSKEWCSEHSNKGCTEQCDGCWQLKQAWGCEQHNMETAYEAGANYVLNEIKPLISLLRGGARALFEEKIKELKKK